MNKRFAGIIAGTVLTASAVLVPGAAAQPHTHDGRAGDYTSVTVRDGLADMHGQYVFVPHGTSLASGGACYDDSALLIDKLTPVAGWSGYYTVDASCLTSAQPGDDADEQQGVPRPGDQNQTPGDQGQVPGCQTPVQQEQEQGQVPVEDCQIPVVPEPGDCINLPGDCHDDDTEDDTEDVTEEEKEEGSSVVGGAFLGLSALAGLAFLSSQGGGSSASSDADAPAPTTAPATGPVGGPDAKAEAQASRAAQPSPAATTAPAAPVAPEPVAEQKALANTGVEGTLGALAIGLVAVAAGVLLILRRRSF